MCLVDLSLFSLNKRRIWHNINNTAQANTEDLKYILVDTHLQKTYWILIADDMNEQD